MKKRIITWVLLLMLITAELCPVKIQCAVQPAPEISAPGAVLMEPSTGTVLYEKNGEEQRSPASITKIMTLLLIFEALEDGQITLEEEAVTSAYAKSMGGSQVFLEEGEKQTVETLIKCIVVASGNDASVVMAEHLAGSEEEFVKRMNEKAGELGMLHTQFEDCCGLTDSEEHYTTASDVAIVSRELITRFPRILEYSSIWMENIIHRTAQGEKEFCLTNTNKLIRSYEGCVGLKTGSTSVAKYCVSAVAQRGEMTLLAVVMGAPDAKVRFKDAAALLDYGFGKCNLYLDENRKNPDPVPIKMRRESGGVMPVYRGIQVSGYRREKSFADRKEDCVYEESASTGKKRRYRWRSTVFAGWKGDWQNGYSGCKICKKGRSVGLYQTYQKENDKGR